MIKAGLPEDEKVLPLLLDAGAFETAALFVTRTGFSKGEIISNESFAKQQATFANKMQTEIKVLSKRIAVLKKLDLKQRRQEGYPGVAETLKNTGSDLTELISDQASLKDLDSIVVRIEDFKKDADSAEKDVRDDQIKRLMSFKHVDLNKRLELKKQIEDDLDLEMAENRIALLRDGRALGGRPIIEEKNLMDEFANSFLDEVDKKSWPKSLKAYDAAFATHGGSLATEASRQKNAKELMEIFFTLKKNLHSNSPQIPPLLAFLEALGMQQVQLSKLARPQGNRINVWTLELRAKVSPEGWFLPPVFGSQSEGRYQLILAAEDVLVEQIKRALPRSPDEPSFVVVGGILDRSQRNECAEEFHTARLPVVLVDEALTAFASTQRISRLETIFVCGLPYGCIEPYVTNPGALPPEMFFGRDDEIRKIRSRDFEGCLVFGGRQLGKSALLHHVLNTANDPENGIIVVLSQVIHLGLAEKPAEIIWEILHSLLKKYPGVVSKNNFESIDATINDIKRWLNQDRSRRILALFDETDEFMSAESSNGFREIIRLKDLMEETQRQFKVVLAGLHNVQRLYNVVNSPLYHLQAPIVVGPLNRTHDDKRAARDLVVEPMRAAGFRFDDEPEAVEKILSYTNEYPSLVQEFLQGLLRQLNRTIDGKHRRSEKHKHLEGGGPPWTIPTEMLFEHDRFDETAGKIRQKFDLTLRLDVRYALIAYLMAQLANEGRESEVITDGLTVKELYGEALHYWPKAVGQLDLDGFGVILDEMYDLGILGLGHAGGDDSMLNGYCLRTPEVLTMLRKGASIEHELLKVSESEPNVRYDKALNHKGVEIPDGQQHRRQYFPLTDLQLERLFDKNLIGARVVCGLKALGLGQFGSMLNRIKSELPIDRSDFDIQVLETDSVKKITKAFERSPSGKNLRIVVHMHKGSDDEAGKILNFFDNRFEVLQGNICPILLLDATNANLRNLAAGREKATQYIAPWSEDMLRRHLRQVEANHLDLPEIRRVILDAAGGIPDRITTVVSNIRNADKPLAAATSFLNDPAAVGISAIETPLDEALELIITLEAGERILPQDYDAVNDLLRKQVGADLETLAPDLLAMGLLRRWLHNIKIIETSSLGRLVYKISRKFDSDDVI